MKAKTREGSQVKFSSDREPFLIAAQATLRAVASKSTVPALTGILVTAQGTAVTLNGTDLELGIECRFEAEIKEEGQVLLPARYLVDILRRLPEGELTLAEAKGNEYVLVTAGQARFQLLTLPLADFPEVKPQAATELVRLPELTLRSLIQKVSFAAARDGLRQLLTSILISFKAGKLRFVATDGHRLALAEDEMDVGGAKGDYLVPARNLEEVARLITGQSEVIIKTATNQLVFTSEGGTLVSRLVEGKYLPYESVIPREFSHRVLVERIEFLEALERAELFSADKVSAVRLGIGEDGISIWAQSAAIGRMDELVAAEVEGEEIEISFNSRYIIEPLRIISTERVLLEFTGPASAAVISPEGQSGYRYLVMPVSTRTAM